MAPSHPRETWERNTTRHCKGGHCWRKGESTADMDPTLASPASGNAAEGNRAINQLPALLHQCWGVGECPVGVCGQVMDVKCCNCAKSSLSSLGQTHPFLQRIIHKPRVEESHRGPGTHYKHQKALSNHPMEHRIPGDSEPTPAPPCKLSSGGPSQSRQLRAPAPFSQEGEHL